MLAPAYCRFTADAGSGVELLRAQFYGHAYDRHFHDGYAIGLTDAGNQAFRARGARHVSTPGVVIAFAPGEAHDGEAADATGFAYRMLYLPEALVQALLSEAAERPVRPLHFPEPLLRDRQLAQSIAAAARAIAVGTDPLERSSAIADLILALGRAAGTAPRQVGSSEHRAVARVCAALHERLAERLTIDCLAAEAGIGRFRLTRAFTRAHGLPPHAYLMSLRLNAARRRLAAGEAPAQAAIAAGFVDQAHLTREFRRRLGVTPGAYRRMVRSQSSGMPA